MTGPVMLVVLDGFGLGDGGEADSTAIAHAPFFERARRDFPCAQLETSGEAVGLPPGQMGNSEVGHMTMGAGRVVEQDMTRIQNALAAGALAINPALSEALAKLGGTGGRLHLLGLVSDGGVHSHQEQLIAILEHCGSVGVRPILHAFLDGRDTPPKSGLDFLSRLLPNLEASGGQVATVCGRYWAMDRDERWDRIQKAYDALVLGEGQHADDPLTAIRDSYQRDERGDEFILPTVIEEGPRISDGDGVLFFNFRADRARQLTNAITGVQAQRFAGELNRRKVVDLASFVCLTEYDASFGLPVAFPREVPRQSLGEVLSDQRVPQLRMAETEKYAHVTFFFNGGREEPFALEDRVLIPSPRDVPTYDHKPEMSALELTTELLRRIRDEEYGFILVNYANPDMVGHTGVLPAAVKAVETLDACLDRVSEAILSVGGTALITADHGNCELMRDPKTGSPHTAHTTNPVPLFWVTADPKNAHLRNGGLADLAPTLLDLLGLPGPEEMSGQSLIVRDGSG